LALRRHKILEQKGDQAVAAAMIHRMVHHAEFITRKGSSHRLRNSGIDTLPSARAENTAH